MKLDHMVIYASDQTKSAAFYGAVLGALGFTKTRDWVWLNKDGFAIDLRKATSDASYDRYGPGLNHLGFAAPSRETLQKVQDDLSASGMSLPDVQNISGAHC